MSGEANFPGSGTDEELDLDAPAAQATFDRYLREWTPAEGLLTDEQVEEMTGHPARRGRATGYLLRLTLPIDTAADAVGQRRRKSRSPLDPTAPEGRYYVTPAFQLEAVPKSLPDLQRLDDSSDDSSDGGSDGSGSGEMRWQPRAVIKALTTLAARRGRSHEGVIAWLHAPTTYLDDSSGGSLRPLDYLEHDPQRVYLAAEATWGVEW